MAEKSPTNEQSKKKAEEDNIAGIPAEAFNAQVLLLDAFIGNLKAANVEVHAGPTVKEYESNVPFAAPAAKTINTLTYSDLTNIAKVQNYVDNITPIDVAQMLPDIQLEIVDGTTYETIFVVPLTDPGDLTAGFSGPGYYTTKTVGLKSLELFLDGSDNPFFGTVYNVNMQMVFDSANTFFDNAPGTNLTYAQIFRSSGKVASGEYFTRLTLGMSSKNQTLESVFGSAPIPIGSIEQKFNLKDPVMTLALNLQLVKTNIKIDPNLKTIITVDYISQEEAMFNSQEIFDFLGLDLADQQRELKKELSDAKENKLILEKTAQLRQKEKLADIEIKKDIAKRKYDEAAALVAQRERELEDARARDQGGTEVNKVSMRLGYAQSVLSNRENELRVAQKAVAEEKKKDAIKEFKKEYGEKSFKNIEDKIENAKNKFANVRMDQIMAAIDAILNDPNLYLGDSPAIRTISITAEEVKEYYLQGTNVGYDGVKQKNLGSKPKGSSKNTPFNASNPNPKTKSQAKKEIKQRNTGGFSGFFADSAKKSAAEKNPGENSKTLGSVDIIVSGLSNQKNIQYILLGDFIRLLIKRLYDIRGSQTFKSAFGFDQKALDKQRQYVQILNKTSILLSKIRFKNMESKDADVIKDIYSIPISVSHITHIIAKHTFGKSKNFFTIFEMIQRLVDLISNSRRRKANILNVVDYAGGFAISKRTYSMIKEAGGTIRVAGQGDSAKDTLHGIVFYAKRVKETTSETNLKPTFVFGGVDRGIVNGFAIESLQDDSFAKMIDEELQNSANAEDNIIPLMFKCQLQTLPAFFFQLGTVFSVVAPSLDIANSQFFLEGDYRVMSVKHTYQAGGTFKTSISGYMDSTNTSENKSGKPEKTAEERRDAINDGAKRKLRELKQKQIDDAKKIFEDIEKGKGESAEQYFQARMPPKGLPGAS